LLRGSEIKKLSSFSLIFFLIISVNYALAGSDNLTTNQSLVQNESNFAGVSQIEVIVHDISNNPIREATIILTLNSSGIPKIPPFDQLFIYFCHQNNVGGSNVRRNI